MESISGKKALVIGGSGGIGAAVSQKLADCGAHLTIHGSRSSEKFSALIYGLQKKVPVKSFVQFFSADLSLDFSHSPLDAALKDSDIVCLCFGPFLQKPLHKTEVADWQMLSTLNYALPGIVVSSALSQMAKRKWGRFLLMGGTKTDRVKGFITNAAYGGAKTALASLVRSTAIAYAQDGITCNGIFPGFTKTEYLSHETELSLAQKMPQRRLIQTEEIAEAAVFLLQQPMINGALLCIDGGWN